MLWLDKERMAPLSEERTKGICVLLSARHLQGFP